MEALNRFTCGEEVKFAANLPVIIVGDSNSGKSAVSARLADLVPGTTHISVDVLTWRDELAGAFQQYLHERASRNDPALAEHFASHGLRMTPVFDASDLAVTSLFMGMLGNPAQGGLLLPEFWKQMAIYTRGEKAVMLALDRHIREARPTSEHIVIDASGSLCHLIDIYAEFDPILALLRQNCLVVNIESGPERQAKILENAAKAPKPILIPKDFLQPLIPELVQSFGVRAVAEIDPAALIGWVRPRLITERRRLYRAITSQCGGVTISDQESYGINDFTDLRLLVARKIDEVYAFAR